MRVFLDTNILIDYLAHREPYYEAARKTLVLSALGEFEPWMGASQMADVFYLLTAGPEKMDPIAAKGALRRLRQHIRVGSLSEAEIDDALESPWEDFEDACVYQTAVALNVDVIVSRNQKDFLRSSIKVMDCQEFFAFLEEEHGLAYEEIDL